MSTLADINDRDDIEQLVISFYQQILSDPIVGFLFTDIAAINLEKHLPKIIDFWCWQLFGEHHYHGNPFAVHRQLHLKSALTEDHFHRWVYLFHKAIDESYSGSKADMAKDRAENIARSMSTGLNDRHTAKREMSGVQLYPPEDDISQ